MWRLRCSGGPHYEHWKSGEWRQTCLSTLRAPLSSSMCEGPEHLTFYHPADHGIRPQMYLLQCKEALFLNSNKIARMDQPESCLFTAWTVGTESPWISRVLLRLSGSNRLLGDVLQGLCRRSAPAFFSLML